MFLVDTSVWIDFLQGIDTKAVDLLVELLENPLATGITDQIYLEILQGARDSASFDKLQLYFSGQRFYPFSDSLQSHQDAARIYFECRRHGVTVRSSNDCLIAQCAREHDLTLLHNDRDFLGMARVAPDLKQRHFLD